MEKFSAWRDKATGMHPFLRVPTKKNALYYLNLLLGSAVALVKLPFVLTVSLWLLMFSVVATLIPIASVRFYFRRYIYALGCRTMLFFFGFYNIPINVVSLRNTRAVEKKQDMPSHGDIILSNHVCVTDILYYAFRFGGCFAFPARQFASNAKPSNKVVMVSLFRALYLTLFHFGLRRGDDSLSQSSEYFFKNNAMLIGDACVRARQRQTGPIVLFVEGAVSNNSAVLSPMPVLCGATLPSTTKIFPFALKYGRTDLARSFVVYDGLSFLWRLASQWHNSLTVLRLSNDERLSTEHLCSAVDGALCEQGYAESAAAQAASHAPSMQLAALLRARRVALTCNDKVAFADKWLNRTSKTE